MTANPVIYILLNGSLNMSSGKAAAQAAHAAALVRKSNKWNKSPSKIVVLEAKDENQLRTLKDYLKRQKINSHLVTDEYVDFTRYQITALGVNAIRDDEKARDLFRDFKLFSVDSEYRKKYLDAQYSIKRMKNALLSVSLSLVMAIGVIILEATL